MENRMLVTQALDERDLLVKKIRDRISKASFTDTMKHNEEKVYDSRVSREEFRQAAESGYQQIMDLIDRFQRLDSAIVLSNASNYVDTSYGKFTVAGAIALRNRLRGKGVYGNEGDFEGELLKKMQTEHQSRVVFAENKNRQLQTAAEGMRLSILGKDSKVKEEKPLEVVEAYVRENTTELVDPLEVQKKIQELNEKRATLLQELDTRIKVSNATTFIEF